MGLTAARCVFLASSSPTARSPIACPSASSASHTPPLGPTLPQPLITAAALHGAGPRCSQLAPASAHPAMETAPPPTRLERAFAELEDAHQILAAPDCACCSNCGHTLLTRTLEERPEFKGVSGLGRMLWAGEPSCGGWSKNASALPHFSLHAAAQRQLPRTTLCHTPSILHLGFLSPTLRSTASSTARTRMVC